MYYCAHEREVKGIQGQRKEDDREDEEDSVSLLLSSYSHRKTDRKALCLFWTYFLRSASSYVSVISFCFSSKSASFFFVQKLFNHFFSNSVVLWLLIFSVDLFILLETNTSPFVGQYVSWLLLSFECRTVCKVWCYWTNISLYRSSAEPA